MSNYIIKNGDLVHAGVKGMKWGVRRYQNPDGSLTEAGKKRYNKLTSRADKIATSYSKLTRMSKEDAVNKLDNLGKRNSGLAWKHGVVGGAMSGAMTAISADAYARGHRKTGIALGILSGVRLRMALAPAGSEKRYARVKRKIDKLINPKT